MSNHPTPSSRLGDILSLPPEELYYHHHWRTRLCHDDDFHREVRSACRDPKRRGELDGALELLEKWCQKFVSYSRDCRVKDDYDRLSCILWAGRYVSTHPGDEILKTAAFLKTGRTPAPVGRHLDWAWLCIRSLAGDPSSLRDVPFVTVRDGKEGRICTLHIEGYSDGVGILSHHPADCFRTRVHPDSEKSLQIAWKSARQNPESPVMDASYSLRDAQGAFLEDLKGPSLGGAAAAGFDHLLAATYPDPDQVVIAKLGATGAPEPVDTDQLAIKVRAVLAAGGPGRYDRFSQIVVVGEESARGAMAEIRKAGLPDGLAPEVRDWAAP